MLRKTPITPKAELTTLLASSNAGTHALILDDEDILRLLRTAIEREGSISAFAKRYGLERTNLTNVLNVKRPVSSSLAKQLGFRKVYTFNDRNSPPSRCRGISNYDYC
jgi:hypothetical protein